MITTTPAATGAPADMAATFDRLEELQWRCEREKANKHDQVIALIGGCIAESIVTGPQIIGTVAGMGFNPRHVGKLLNDNIGHLWHRDGDRFYATLPPLN